MWRNQLTVAWRFLLADRLFTFVNLFGLGIGLAAVVLIALHGADTLGSDRHLPGHLDLYRVDTLETAAGREPVDIARAPGPLAAALLASFPEIEGASRAYPVEASLVIGGQAYEQEVLTADSNFFQLLRLPLRSGTAQGALAHPGAVAISERAAIRYFGTAAAVGRRLTLVAPTPRDVTVSAVFETLPANSHMDFDLVMPAEAYFPIAGEEAAGIPENWGGAYFHTYVRLKPGTDPASIERHLPALVDRSLPDWLTSLLSTAPRDFYRFRFVPLSDLPFDGGAVGAMKPKASRTTLLALSSVALLILAIATVNFANLTTARSTLRSREVAIRKVVGARRTQIFAQFMAEALLLTALAGLLGISLVELTYPWFAGFLGMPEAMPAGDWRFWSMVALGIVATAVAAGFYPSVILSRVRPARLLGGREEAVRVGAIRSALVVLQFAVSIGLIATTAVMLMQLRYAAAAELAFDQRNLLVLRAPDAPGSEEALRSLREALAREPGVAGIALSSSVPSDESEDNLSIDWPGEAEPLQLGFHRVDPDFFRAYRVALLAGRTGPPPPEGSDVRHVVINRKALERLGFTRPEQSINRVLRSGKTELRIVAVVPDMHFRSLRETVREELFILDETPGQALSLRYDGAALAPVLRAVERRWREHFPGRGVDRAFLDDRLAALYEAERRQARLLTAFAGIAILLSCLGLAGMAAFAARRRAREIAIRKVLGARSRDIVRLLAWQFGKPVIAAAIIAWPLSWWLMRDWLNGFERRIELGPGPFFAAGLLALLIAIGAIAGHAVKVARANPIHALRYE
jgi:putative ABC transport system permease protein